MKAKEDKNDYRRSLIGTMLRKVLPAVVALAVIVLFFNKLIFSNLVLARGDIYLYFHPYWKAAARALETGRLPLWNPNLFMGAPFLANSQAGFLYPFNWALWLSLPTHYALNATIVIHIIVGAMGAYFAARACLSLKRGHATFVGLLFALGGYMTAQVEHINQIQGLAWMPWFFFVSCRWFPSPFHWRDYIKLVLSLGLLSSLQFLSGHTQTFFITFAGMLLWLGTRSIQEVEITPVEGHGSQSHITSKFQRLVFTISPLILGGLLAILISGAQVLPTLELITQSSRQGGLPSNEVLSFSLHPLLITKTLLPAYEQALFSEYVAVFPLTGLFLALVGFIGNRRHTVVQAIAILLFFSFFLALGLFNPLNHLIARIPGFNLFRVPARWLILYTLMVALLAGLGLQTIQRNPGAKNTDRTLRFASIVFLILLVSLLIWGFLATFLVRFIPVGAEASVESPNLETIIAWLVELIILALLIIGLFRFPERRNLVVTGFAMLALLSLFATSRSLPYANPTTPEAYEDLRPSITRLWAGEDCSLDQVDCPLPPARFLSLSNIFFDVGDQPEIDTIYERQLSEAARYDYTIAIKQKEIIGPNLGLAYGLSAVDGFDGGVLPLRSYALLSSLLLIDGQVSTDGRMRENLSSIPDDHWLDLFNARYVITDKVGDTWRNGIFFDLQHNRTVHSEGDGVGIGYIPPFEATDVWVLTDGYPGTLGIETLDGSKWTLNSDRMESDLYRFAFPNPAVLSSIDFMPCDPDLNDECQNEFELLGAALVDTRDESFFPLVPGNFRMVHSGDVKIYENLDVLPRAFIVDEWQTQPDLESSIRFLNSATFDPSSTAVIVANDVRSQKTEGDSSVQILNYEPERISFEVDGSSPGLLVLSDAYYPGWEASLDGNSAEIFQTNGLFRGVEVPAGKHEVEMIFNPTSFKIGVLASAAGLFIWFSLAGFLVSNNRKHRRSALYHLSD